nr:YwqG family protein [Micrococcus endophyticus]
MPVTASKLGGVPYLAPDAEQPRDEDGEPLMFLLQIRCEELPPNEFLPESGLLQFWHGTDDLMGADLDDPLESAVAVLHIEDPDQSVTAEDVLER